MEFKEKFKQKIVRIKQWLDSLEAKADNYIWLQFILIIVRLCDFIKVVGIIALVIKYFLRLSYILLPYLIEFIEFIETLASTFSYKRRSFFMDFTQSMLYGVSNKKYLSELLHLKLKTLKNVDKYYTVYPFEKKTNGKTRELYNPLNEHKRALKRLTGILNKIKFPSYLCGGIQNVSYVDNASRHLNKDYMLLLDIANFFPSTRDSYVYDFFYNSMSQPPDIAKILVNLATAKVNNHRHLPQGYSTSPVLSFLSYHRMYQELYEYSLHNGFTFSAYYDDFTFSSNKFIHPNRRRDIIKIIEKYDFKVNSKKTKLVIGNHVNITGVIINKNERKAPKKLFKKTHDYYLLLLEMERNFSLYDQYDFINICNRFQGCLSVIQHIEPNRNLEYYYNKLRYIRKKVIIAN